MLSKSFFTLPAESLKKKYGSEAFLGHATRYHGDFNLKNTILKEQYPVTAHAPNFDFWTGCREIKRCEKSKRTLKNPFESRLAGFNTTLKLLRITDQ